MGPRSTLFQLLRAAIEPRAMRRPPVSSIRLFWRLKAFQQLADIRRVQGISPLTIDALIFPPVVSLLEHEP